MWLYAWKRCTEALNPKVWGCATKSHIAVIQRYQSKLLRSITNAPWYVTKPYSPLRPTHPIRPRGLQGTDSDPSNGPGLAPQPPHGTSSTPANQQAFKAKMNI